MRLFTQSNFSIMRVVGLCAYAVLSANLSAGQAMHETAIPAVRPAGAPEYADVSLRYGWVRSSFPTVYHAMNAVRGFHATRVDWFYTGEIAGLNATYVTDAAQDFIDWCHANGMKITGAMHTNTSNSEWSLRPTQFNRYLGDPDNSLYAAEAVKWGKAMVDAGVAAFVVDDFFFYDNPAQMQSFNDNVLKPIKAYAPNFKIASNKGSSLGTIYVTPYDFDFHYSDTSIVTSPRDWWEASKAHRAEKSALLSHPNLPNMSNGQRRQLIALSYAVGAHLIAPWDEYIQGGTRLFADPADFADLYGFVRAMGQKAYLNGYEDAAVGGYDLSETRYGNSPPLSVSGGSGYLSVFARAKPGDGFAPVVVHLVQFGAAQATTLRVRIDSLFDTSNVSCTLYSPKTYDAALHETARNTGDYSALAQASNVSYSVNGDFLEISIPAFAPWGILVITNQNHRIQISPVSAQVFPGESQTFTGTVLDPSGDPVSPQPAISWSADSAGSINATGLFTAVNAPTSGTVTATASLGGGVTATGQQSVSVVSEFDSGIVARWQFNGDANDSVGANHGTRYGGGSYSTSSKEGSNSLFLDGIDNYVQVPNHPDLDVGSGDFSYSFWFQREANTADNLRLISKGSRVDSSAGYSMSGSNTSISAILGNGVSRKFIGASHGGVGAFTHTTVTIDRSAGLMKLYVNGTLASQTDISDWNGQNLNSSEDLYFGRTASDSTPLFWHGRIDDAKIYNKALSAVEVSALFGSSSSPVSPEPATWKSVPQATGYTSIRMEANAVAGDNVQYWFDEISGNEGGADSGWQDSPVFEATGLLAGTTYTYRVKVRFLSANPSATAFSASVSASTGALPPSLIAISPADDADFVALDVNLVATFDEAMARGLSGSIELWEAGAAAPLETFPVATSSRLLFSGQSVTIDPTAVMALGKSYHVRIDPGALVSSGTGAVFAGISDPTVWNFTADSRYASWIAAQGMTGSLSVMYADYDGDGIANILENYFGTDPTRASRGMEILGADHQARTFSFIHPKNANPASGIVGRYRWSCDLVNWQGSGETLNGCTVSLETRTLGSGDVEVTATESGEPLTKLFVTLEVLDFSPGVASAQISTDTLLFNVTGEDAALSDSAGTGVNPTLTTVSQTTTTVALGSGAVNAFNTAGNATYNDPGGKYDLDATTGFSVAFFVNVAAFTNNGTIMSIETGTTRALSIRTTSAGNIRAFTQDTGAPAGWIGTGSVASPLVDAPLGGTTDTWFHFALTAESGAFRAYVNGTQVDIDTIPWTPSSTLDVSKIMLGDGSFETEGRIYLDEIGVWGSVLTAEEVAALAGGAWRSNSNETLLFNVTGEDAALSDSVGTGVNPTLTTVSQTTTTVALGSGAVNAFNTAGNATYNDPGGKYDLDATTGFSVAFFVNVAAFTNNGTIMSIETGTARALSIRTTSAGNIRAFTQDTGAPAGWIGTGSVASPLVDASLGGTTGTWYHYALTAESGAFRAYVNGTQVDIDTIPWTPSSTLDVSKIMLGDGSFETEGRIYLDAIGVWDSVLTADEVAALAGGAWRSN